MRNTLTADSLQLAGRNTIRSHKDLVVWQRAMHLAKEIYAATENLPSTEQFGLISQMRRAAISIPSNIAEGKKRGSRKDFVQFLRIADGSAAELETQLLLSQDLFKKDYDRELSILGEVQRMLGSMLLKLSAVSRKL